jgi:hypothetical protein
MKSKRRKRKEVRMEGVCVKNRKRNKFVGNERKGKKSEKRLRQGKAGIPTKYSSPANR